MTSSAARSPEHDNTGRPTCPECGWEMHLWGKHGPVCPNPHHTTVARLTAAVLDVWGDALHRVTENPRVVLAEVLGAALASTATPGENPYRSRQRVVVGEMARAWDEGYAAAAGRGTADTNPRPTVTIRVPEENLLPRPTSALAYLIVEPLPSGDHPTEPEPGR